MNADLCYSIFGDKLAALSSNYGHCYGGEEGNDVDYREQEVGEGGAAVGGWGATCSHPWARERWCLPWCLFIYLLIIYAGSSVYR